LLPRMVIRVGFAMLLLSLLSPVATAQPIRTSPSEILGNADRFDGQAVTLSGTVTNLQEQVSRAGRPYYTFDLSDGTEAVRVFSFGKARCRSGGATVDGTFAKVKQQAQYTFPNEVTATRVRCR
jgi:DNA polymerase III alpha subunit